MKRTKPGKATGVDKVCPELLTADIEDTGSRLTSCYNRLWETDRSGSRKCGGRNLLSYLRKVVCVKATTREE